MRELHFHLVVFKLSQIKLIAGLLPGQLVHVLMAHVFNTETKNESNSESEEIFMSIRVARNSDFTVSFDDRCNVFILTPPPPISYIPQSDG